MEIHIDLVPPEDGYFISIELSDKESLGINNTWTGRMIKKQILIGNKEPDKEPDRVWETLEVLDGEPKKKREAEWVDKGEIDVINNKVWKTIDTTEIPKEIDEKLTELYLRIYDNRNNLDSAKKDLEELDRFLSNRIDGILDRF